MPNDMMIEAEELAKRYGETQALAGVDFCVPGRPPGGCRRLRPCPRPSRSAT
jgi:hypothetical protein